MKPLIVVGIHFCGFPPMDMFHWYLNVCMPKTICLKVQQSLPGQRENGEGLWLNSLDSLPVCYTQHSILTVLYVICYQSVTRNSINSSGYVYNRELITQPTPISHSPGNFKIENIGCIFSQTHVSGGVFKNMLVSISCVTSNLDACKVSFLYYL